MTSHSVLACHPKQGRKTRAVNKVKAERGERSGARTPYGCRKDANDKKLGIGREAAAAVRHMKAGISGADHFRSNAKRYTDIAEPAPELSRLSILKTVVHKKHMRRSKRTGQTGKVYDDLDFVGNPADKAA